MSQAPVPTYRVEYEPSRGSWLLTGPVGAKGCLRYTTARDAADYARWDARASGGKKLATEPKIGLVEFVEPAGQQHRCYLR